MSIISKLIFSSANYDSDDGIQLSDTVRGNNLGQPINGVLCVPASITNLVVCKCDHVDLLWNAFQMRLCINFQFGSQPNIVTKMKINESSSLMNKKSFYLKRGCWMQLDVSHKMSLTQYLFSLMS